MLSNAFFRRSVIASIILLGAVWTIITPRLVDGKNETMNVESTVEGYPAPDFQLQDNNGFNYRLSDFTGRVVVLNFWASWCTPCTVEMPAFQSATREYSIDEVIFLGINLTSQDEITNVLAFLDENGITFPILLDQTGSTSNLYQVFSMPTTYFIDKEGIIRKVIIGGPVSKAAIRAEISKLLDK